MSERPPLTVRRFFGLDRSGPPPPETLPDAPLRPWTIPNAIGYVRLALIPVFLVAAWDVGGVGLWPALLFAVISWGDYLDGIAARVTGQYSRMGALLDPVVDRLLVISGVVVCWHFDLLPRWLLGLLIAREALMLLAAPFALRRGVELKINWWGRWGVWPAMASLFFAMCGLETLGAVLLAIGVALLVIATVEYGRDAVRQLRERNTSTSG
ncbi:MAG: CDP-alcohol phosphatidyltransferase family protein [Solirubrobacteraceae bacterium]|nr:CDP-alcohol phosphatidyltransferase family protein [Solirubrobacteraceae bacterium]